MWPWNASTQGELYLFHFHQPLGNLSNPRAQALHYVGFSDDLVRRLADQFAGRGTRIVAAAVTRGITFDIYHWPACLAVEKLVKKTKKASLYCPTCCKAAGRPVRPLPVPAVQLALPLSEAEDWLADLPPAPARAMDWLEIRITQQWRQARAIGTIDLAAIDDLL